MFVNLSRATFSPAERLDNVVQSSNLTSQAYKISVKKDFINSSLFLFHDVVYLIYRSMQSFHISSDI